MPEQVLGGVWVDTLQVASAHWVPAAYSRQAPRPSQEPSVPQLAAP